MYCFLSFQLYSLFFSAAAVAIQTSTERAQWVTSLKQGIDAITKYGGAEVGDRTMVNTISYERNIHVNV